MTTAAQAVPQDTQAKQLTLKEELGIYNLDGSVEFLRALFYGEPSSGKTHLLGTLEEDPEEFLPALIIDADGGMDTIRSKNKIDITPRIHEPDDLKKIYDAIAAESTRYSCPYRTIAFDHMSEFQKIDMQEIMREAKLTANDPSKVNISVPSQREWGISADHIRTITRAFTHLPCHFICLAHMQQREDKITKVNAIWPGLDGQMRNGIVGFFSVAGYQSVYEEGGETHRQIQFKKTKRVQARDRFQVLPDIMTGNPTIPQIWKIIKDSGAKIVEDDPLKMPAPALVPQEPAPASTDTIHTIAEQLQGAITQ